MFRPSAKASSRHRPLAPRGVGAARRHELGGDDELARRRRAANPATWPSCRPHPWPGARRRGRSVKRASMCGGAGPGTTRHAAPDRREHERPLEHARSARRCTCARRRRTGSRRPRAAAGPSSQRSGANRSGSAKYAARRCTTHWLITIVPPLGDAYGPELVGSRGDPRQRPHRRVQTQRLAEDRLGVRQTVEVGSRRAGASPSTAASSAAKRLPRRRVAARAGTTSRSAPGRSSRGRPASA